MLIKDNIQGGIKLQGAPANLYAQQMINNELELLRRKLENNKKRFPEINNRGSRGGEERKRFIAAIEAINKDIVEQIRNLTMTLNSI